MLAQEFGHTLQHMAKVCPLVRHPMMDEEVPLDVADTDVQEADASSELGGQAPGLALSVHATKQGHGVVGAGHGDLRQRLIIRDAGHPGRVEELRVGRVVIVRSLNGTVTQTKDSKTQQRFVTLVVFVVNQVFMGDFSCSQRKSKVHDVGVLKPFETIPVNNGDKNTCIFSSKDEMFEIQIIS